MDEIKTRNVRVIVVVDGVFRDYVSVEHKYLGTIPQLYKSIKIKPIRKNFSKAIIP